MEGFIPFVSVLGLSVVIGLIAHLIIFKTTERLSKKTKTIVDDLVVKHCRPPSRLILPLLAYHFLIPLVQNVTELHSFLSHAFSILFIVSVAWLAVKLTVVFEDFIVLQYEVKSADNLRARTIHTQTRIIKKILVAIIIVLAIGTVLMSFSKVRQLGTSILASAGIVGIVVGIAAQRTIGTLLAGIQVAITQPFRLDDVVIVENEWGWIEEITLTYVVIRIWDLRRLVVPITQFLERPFQNWTRSSSDILGSVFIYVDYTIPVSEIRKQLKEIVEQAPQWDGKVCVLHVTNAKEHTVELRALLSASDSPKAWELRCYVREKLIEFIQEKYPDSLPKLRTNFGQLQESPVPQDIEFPAVS
jgi:small-conductance mechanosensitive channel